MARTISSPDYLSRELRLQHKELRQGMKRCEVVKASALICEKLYESSWYSACTWIYGYYPLGNEVDCRSFLEIALADKKRVALPRMAVEAVHADVCHMDFYEITALEQVTEGRFGVLEPLEACPLVWEQDAVVLVPGVVFDRQGNRYGYGKGYYDRYFARFPGLYKAALAYENQMEEHIKVSKTDVKMDCIYTEQEVCLLTERTGKHGITGNL